MTNSGEIVSTAASGDAEAISAGADENSLAFADASAMAEGIEVEGTDNGTAGDLEALANVENGADITVSAVAGNAAARGTGTYDSEYYYSLPDSGVYAYANAEIYGIRINSYAMAKADANDANARANIVNSDDVAATAIGGNATAVEIGNSDGETPFALADTSVGAMGLRSYGVIATMDTDVEAADGDYGIDAHTNIENTGNISVTAIAGIAKSESSAEADSYSYSYAAGISAFALGNSDLYGPEAFGNVINTGALTVKATGSDGTATVTSHEDGGGSSFYALVSSDAEAVGIETHSEGKEPSDPPEKGITPAADGRDTYGTVSNSNTVTVTAAAGNAVAAALKDGGDIAPSARANTV